MSALQHQDITSVLRETRKFPPSDSFKKQARLGSVEEYDELYRQSVEDPESFWAEMAGRELEWSQPWETVLEWKPPFAKWFIGGKINIAHNCLDRHVEDLAARTRRRSSGRASRATRAR